MSELDRRNMLKTGGALAAVALTAATALAEEEQRQEEPGNRGGGGRCLLTLQLNDLDPAVLSDEEKTKQMLERVVPFIAQEMVRAKSQPRSRGCSVSGTAFGGSGGWGGSGTITCTF